MSERWTYGENPSHFNDYNWASDELPARKFYLFIAEVGRRVRHLMTDPGPIAMTDLCEKCAEDQVTEDEISDRAYRHRPQRVEDNAASHAANNLYWWVADRYKVNVEGVLWVATGCQSSATRWRTPGARTRRCSGTAASRPFTTGDAGSWTSSSARSDPSLGAVRVLGSMNGCGRGRPRPQRVLGRLLPDLVRGGLAAPPARPDQGL